MPTETLSTALCSVTNTNGDTSTPSLTEVGSSWWLGFANPIGNTLSIDSMTDLLETTRSNHLEQTVLVHDNLRVRQRSTTIEFSSWG